MGARRAISASRGIDDPVYRGIDLRLRQAEGVPEYDLLLQPFADLSQVTVRASKGSYPPFTLHHEKPGKPAKASLAVPVRLEK